MRADRASLNQSQTNPLHAEPEIKGLRISLCLTLVFTPCPSLPPMAKGHLSTHPTGSAIKKLGSAQAAMDSAIRSRETELLRDSEH